MKRWLGYLLVIAVAAVLGSKGSGTDVGKLCPVQVLAVKGQGSVVTLQTDTGEQGTGRTVSQAVEAMRRTASGEIFLDTVDYLLLSEGAEKWLPELKDHLRPSCRLYHTYGKPDMETAGTYLEQHPSQVTLRLWLAGEWNLPKLIIREGRMELEP